jgi:hypothetical protein
MFVALTTVLNARFQLDVYSRTAIFISYFVRFYSTYIILIKANSFGYLDSTTDKLKPIGCYRTFEIPNIINFYIHSLGSLDRLVLLSITLVTIIIDCNLSSSLSIHYFLGNLIFNRFHDSFFYIF